MTPSTKTASQQLAAALASEIPASRIAKVLSDAMAADIMNRDGSRSPDHRQRVASAEIALARLYGLPIRREESVVVNLDAEQSSMLEERLARSPALRRSLADMIAKVEAEAPAIDV